MADKDMLDFVIKITEEAGRVVMSKFRNVEEYREKSEHDYVTDADLESDSLLTSRIRNKYPDHAITTEESGKTKGKGYEWIIDPLDGTNNFFYGIPVFGVSVAVTKNGKPYIGVINMPILGETYYAQKGKGAFMNGKEIRVSHRKFDDSFLIYEPHLRGPGRKEQMLQGLSAMVERVARVRILGAATMNFILIAGGSADMWFECPIKPWDIAAGCLIVEEAGGKVTTFDGKPWHPYAKSMVVTNGRVHGELLGIIKNDLNLR